MVPQSIEAVLSAFTLVKDLVVLSSLAPPALHGETG